jgi:hypothetical protein
MLQRYDTMKERMREFAEEYKGIIVQMDRLDPDAKVIEDDVLKVLEQPLTTDGVAREALGYDGAGMSSKRTNEKLTAIARKIAGYGPSIAQRKSNI